MTEEETTIRLKQTTKKRLDGFGKKGDSYDDILNNLMDRVKELKK